VKVHLEQILDKPGASDRTHAITIAARRRFIGRVLNLCGRDYLSSLPPEASADRTGNFMTAPHFSQRNSPVFGSFLADGLYAFFWHFGQTCEGMAVIVPLARGTQI